MKLKDQVAIVTGAGRNIGEEIAKVMAQNGAKVAVVDMDSGRGNKVAGEIIGHGGEAAAFVADISSEADVSKLIADIIGRWGRVDILVNNAAISDNKDILEITKAQWDKVLAVTLTGPFLMSQHTARAMAVQLAPHNIRVNGVVPNKIGSPVGKDEFDPTRPVVNLRGRNGVPMDMARAVLFLVSDDSDFIVGDMLFVDGGVSAILVGDAAATRETRPTG